MLAVLYMYSYSVLAACGYFLGNSSCSQIFASSFLSARSQQPRPCMCSTKGDNIVVLCVMDPDPCMDPL
jgi:hypothetical protein